MEVLLAMAILAMLMAAMGAGVKTAMSSYHENENLATSSQSARAVLTRILTDIRTCAAVNATATQITILPADANTVQQIQYDFVSGALYYRRTTAAGTTSYPMLAGNVGLTSFVVSQDTGLDWQGLSCITELSIRMGVCVDRQVLSISGSAAPRRNQLY